MSGVNGLEVAAVTDINLEEDRVKIIIQMLIVMVVVQRSDIVTNNLIAMIGMNGVIGKETAAMDPKLGDKRVKARMQIFLVILQILKSVVATRPIVALNGIPGVNMGNVIRESV